MHILVQNMIKKKYHPLRDQLSALFIVPVKAGGFPE
jgi:hypothetical protein